MKKIIIVCAVLLPLFFAKVQAGPQGKANKQTEQWRYELEVTKGTVGVQGTCQVKVWSYSKNQNAATEQCKKNAVHGIVFKGYGSNKPLVQDLGAAKEHEDFFDKFFANGGDYMNFVTTSGVPDAGDIIKVGKEYKVGLVVNVRKDDLRKHLEKAGIIKPLNRF